MDVGDFKAPSVRSGDIAREGRPTTKPQGSRGFGGWRDWLLVIVGAPLVLAGMVVVAVIGWNGGDPNSLAVAIGLVVAACLAGALRAKTKR